MKLKILFVSLFVFSSLAAYSQQNVSVNIENDIYEIIDYAQLKGMCSVISGVKPYTQGQIKRAVNEIYDSGVELTDYEAKILAAYLHSLEKNEESKNNVLHVNVSNENTDFPLSFNYCFSQDFNAAGALYSNSDYSKKYNFEIIPAINFNGDISKYLSYAITGFADITQAKLMDRSGNGYFVGYNWYEQDVKDYLSGTSGTEPQQRKINSFFNTASLPYRYNHRWSGQVYYLSNMSASGLEGWPNKLSLGLGIESEVNFSAFEDRILLKFGRVNREWAGMDKGSSLVLNAYARPFTALESSFKIFDFLRFEALVGSLEYPNQDYISYNSYNNFPANSKTTMDDSYFFQNAFTINMLELDFTHVHIDFGSTVVWPKRFELGYMLPLTNYVVYQNSLGDYDNLSLFGDLAFRKEGVGKLWFSLYLDELNGLNNNPFTSSRAMYAYQTGLKFVIPKLTYATLSIRYTKVEPYCYTHQAINYTPWFNQYIFESYTNGGSCLGYYMPPNSDELLIDFNFRANHRLTLDFNYQFSRHGADFGPQPVPGSSLYSELCPENRDDIKKYFLHDGAYNWIHALNVAGTMKFDNPHVPFQLSAGVGVIFSYFTTIASEDYSFENKIYNKKSDFGTKYSIADSDEYPTTVGVVLSVGGKVMFK